MYCPHCGTESTQGLNYCNRCGGNLGALATNAAQESRPAISTGTAWAVGLTTAALVLIGLGILLGTLTDLAHVLPSDAIAFIMVCGSLTVLASAALLMRFWMRLLVGRKQSGLASLIAARRAAKGELGPARMSALPDPPFSSVTEHTTRTLEHVKK
jgi:hypothetical protein